MEIKEYPPPPLGNHYPPPTQTSKPKQTKHKNLLVENSCLYREKGKGHPLTECAARGGSSLFLPAHDSSQSSVRNKWNPPLKAAPYVSHKTD